MPCLLEWVDAGMPQALELDVAENEGYEATAELSEHVVDRGANVADHIRRANGVITIEGTITNSPLRALAPTLDQRAVTTSIKLRAGAVVVQAVPSPVDRVARCKELFAGLMESGALVKLTTGYDVAEDLAITRVHAERSAKIGDAVHVALEFKAVRFATVQRTAAPVPTQRRGQRPGARGAQPTAPVTSSSALVNAGRSLGVIS